MPAASCQPVDLVAALGTAMPEWRSANHRLPVVISGSPDWVRACARSLLDDDSLWIGPDPPPGVNALSFRRARESLGGECGQVVFNALDGLDPDALGAAGGLPRGGGRMLWLTPPLADWPHRPDPELARLTPWPLSYRDAGGAFVQRLTSCLRAEPRAWLVAEGRPLPAVPSPPDSPALLPTDDESCRTPDQCEAVEQILAVARSRPRRPLVLRSHRGRGKSSALGIAAARVLASGLGDVLVTAPRRVAVEPVFEQAARQAGIETCHPGQPSCGAHRLRFLPPDVLIDQQPPARLLLIDEAAALPAGMLEALFRRYPRVVFSTTEHGYEGTGRGFAIRFAALLDRLAVSVRRLTLTTPVRWAPGDPLEALVDRVLLLDADPAPDEAVDTTPTADIRAVRPADLIADESRLAELFGLLVTAHYRTTPRDLRQMLDAPGGTVWEARSGGHVLATAWTQDEGGLPPELGEAVFAGERRVRGHLLPQTMATHAGEPRWAGLRGRRIQRIAVHPAARRDGLGSRVVRSIAGQAAADGLDFLGVSFGVETELLAFWRAQGLTPLHLGQHRDHASGRQSLVMARGLTPRGLLAVDHSACRFQARLPVLAAGPLRTADPCLLASLLETSADMPVAPPPADWTQIEACAWHHHPLDAALPALRAFLGIALGHPAVRSGVDGQRRALLVARFLQLRETADLAAAFGLDGQQAIDRQCRGALREVLAAVEPGDADHDEADFGNDGRPAD
ncbi:MAG: tRNA(Met) cytidine acetyltransferase TmcA [Guyparkeria sp.]|uniref:tRNA(Met) cytidine acetyltransferase TmcA n=1 Tax=Guyparkeria sp. TaxID=2035736 RepID=UPI00397B2EF8